jgi:hypothetical protein
MKTFFRVRQVLLLVLLMAIFATPAFAQGETPTPPATPLEAVLAMILQFATLAGVGAVIAALVNVLKTFGVVKDGTAGKWFAGLNLVAIVVLVYIRLFQPQIAVEFIDAQAAVLAQILLAILGYIVQLGTGKAANGLFVDLRLPVVGKSYSRGT